MDNRFVDLEIETPIARTHSIWLTSLADLLALMLAFFVLLFSMNEVKISAWREILETLGQKYDPLQIEVSDSPQQTKNILQVNERQAIDLTYLENIYLEKIAASDSLSGIQVSKVGKKLVLSLPADNFFLPGSDKRINSSSEVFQVLTNSLININNRVEIYGHTDPDPITSQTGMFKSNWELSLARAIAIGRELVSMGYQGSIRAYGFGASRFNELSDKMPLGQKYSQSRRVDIIIREASDRGWK